MSGGMFVDSFGESGFCFGQEWDQIRYNFEGHKKDFDFFLSFFFSCMCVMENLEVCEQGLC